MIRFFIDLNDIVLIYQNIIVIHHIQYYYFYETILLQYFFLKLSNIVSMKIHHNHNTLHFLCYH